METNYLKLIQIIMNDYLKNGNTSMARYCETYGYSIRTFREMINYLKRFDTCLFNKVILHINEYDINKKEIIKKDVLNVLEIIKENNNKISPIDYFTNTHYGIVEFLSVADNLLSINDCKLLRTNISPFRRINILNNNNINNLLNSSHQLLMNGELTEIPNIVKKSVINYLKENNIPISYITFNEVCLRFYKNKKQNVR